MMMANSTALHALGHALGCNTSCWGAGQRSWQGGPTPSLRALHTRACINPHVLQRAKLLQTELGAIEV